MDNEKFQEFMTDQFAKMFNVVQAIKVGFGLSPV